MSDIKTLETQELPTEGWPLLFKVLEMILRVQCAHLIHAGGHGNIKLIQEVSAVVMLLNANAGVPETVITAVHKPTTAELTPADLATLVGVIDETISEHDTGSPDDGLTALRELQEKLKTIYDKSR